MSNERPFICKPTKWFILRALAMLVMFSVFAVLFLKDGLTGYKEENLHWYMKKNFDVVGEEFQKRQDEDGFTEAAWKTYVQGRKVEFPDNAEKLLPEGTELDQPLPDELLNGYALMKEKSGQTGAQKLWEEFTKKKSWDAEVGEKAHTEWKIQEQFVATSVVGVLIAITLFFLIRTMRRSISADDEALYTQTGETVKFTDMVRIDKRKWDTKGLALIYYKDGGEEKKAKIDGMVYGQFKEEDGAPAEKLFSHIMENFKGEVIEFVDEDEDDDEEESDAAESSDAALEKAGA